MTDTKQDKPATTADARALRPIGWFMGGVTALCAVMAVVTGCWSQQRAKETFNQRSAAPAVSMNAQVFFRVQPDTRMTVSYVASR